MDFESLYLRLPTSLQHVACSLAGWRIRRARFGGAFRRLQSEYDRRALMPDDAVTELRDARLVAFMQHCAATVPFYRRRFRELGIRPDDVRTLGDLAALPLLTRDEVQDHTTDLISEAVPRRHRILAHTSGTTGSGLRFVTTRRAVHEQWTVWWRYRRWHGITAGTWCGYFGGRSVVPIAQQAPPFWRFNYPLRQILFSGHHMSPDRLDAYAAALRRRRPPWLHGYPSLLTLLAAHLIDSGTSLGYPVRWVTVGAENLLTQQAELLTRAFGVRPIQHYGMAEAVANFSECVHGRLHVDEDFAAVEFVPNGESCSVVGTNFTNLAMPLVRYVVGDAAVPGTGACSCGRPGRLIERIDGRLEDYVVLPSGARLGRLDHVFKDLVNVREAQIRQSRPSELVVRVVRGPRYGRQDEISLVRELRKRVGPDVEIHIEYTDAIERARNGKLRFVVSQLPGGRITAGRQS